MCLRIVTIFKYCFRILINFLSSESPWIVIKHLLSLNVHWRWIYDIDYHIIIAHSYRDCLIISSYHAYNFSVIYDILTVLQSPSILLHFSLCYKFIYRMASRLCFIRAVNFGGVASLIWNDVLKIIDCLICIAFLFLWICDYSLEAFMILLHSNLFLQNLSVSQTERKILKWLLCNITVCFICLTVFHKLINSIFQVSIVFQAA